MPIDPTTFELAKDPAFTKLEQSINGVLTLLKQQGATIAGQQTAIQALANGSAKAKEKPTDDKDDNEPVDIGELKNEDFFKFVIGEVGKVLDKKFTDFDTKISGVAKEFRFGRITDEADKLKGEFKDFNDWTEEMGGLAKQHPTLTLKQLYNLARADNPAKTKELDVKYKDPEPKNEPLSLFGGFKPSAKDVSNGGDEKGKTPEKLTLDQAFEKSWNAAVQSAPQLSKMEDALD